MNKKLLNQIEKILNAVQDSLLKCFFGTDCDINNLKCEHVYQLILHHEFMVNYTQVHCNMLNKSRIFMEKSKWRHQFHILLVSLCLVSFIIDCLFIFPLKSVRDIFSINGQLDTVYSISQSNNKHVINISVEGLNIH